MNHKSIADKHHTDKSSYYKKSKTGSNTNVSGKPIDLDQDSESQTQIETESGRGEDRTCRINTTVRENNNIVIGAAATATGQEYNKREPDSTHFQISNPAMAAIVSDNAKKTLDINSRPPKEQNREAQSMMHNQTKGNARVTPLRFEAEIASLKAQRHHFDKAYHYSNAIKSHVDEDIGHGFDKNQFEDCNDRCDAFLQSAAPHQTSRSDLEIISSNDGSKGSEFLNAAGRVVDNAYCFALGEQHSRNQQANKFALHSNPDNSVRDMKYSKSASLPCSSPDTTKFALNNSAHHNNMNLPHAYRQDSSTGGSLVRHQPKSLELDIVLPSKTSSHSRALAQSMAPDSNHSLATSFNSNNNLMCESPRNLSNSNANFFMGFTKAQPRDDFRHAPPESSIQFSSISENSTPEGGLFLGHNTHLFAGPCFLAPMNHNTPGIDANINNILAQINDNYSICRQTIANDRCVNSSPVSMRQVSSTGSRVAIGTGVGSLQSRSMSEYDKKSFDVTRTKQRHYSLFVSVISLLENESVMETASSLMDKRNYRNLDSSSCCSGGSSSSSSSSAGVSDANGEFIKADKSENSAVKCAVCLSTSPISTNPDDQMTTTAKRQDISGLMNKGSAIIEATCSKHPSSKADNSDFLNNPSFVPINVPPTANLSSQACSQSINSNLGGSSIPSVVVPDWQSSRRNLKDNLKFIDGLKKSFSTARSHILNACIHELENFAASDFLPDSMKGINNQSKRVGKDMDNKMMDLILGNLKLLIERGFTLKIIHSSIALITHENEQMDLMYGTVDSSIDFQFFGNDNQCGYNSIDGRNKKTRLTFSNAASLLDSNKCGILASSNRETKTLFSNLKRHRPSRVQSLAALAKHTGYHKYGGDQHLYNNAALFPDGSCLLGNNSLSNMSTSSMLNPLGIIGSERACDMRNNCEIGKEANSVRKITRRFMPFPSDVVAKLNTGLNQYKYYPTAEQRRSLADSCGITFSQVTSWFSNRRSRKKRKEGKSFDMDSSCPVLGNRHETILPSSISMTESIASGVCRKPDDDLCDPQLQSTTLDETTSALESGDLMMNVDTKNSTEGEMRSGSNQYSENYYGRNNLNSAASAEKNASFFESALRSHEGLGATQI